MTRRMVLEFHDWREEKPTDEHELIALFLFTLRPAADLEAGIRPDRSQAFWTETRLSRDLAARGRWPSLAKKDKLKAMFRFAVEAVVEAGGRKLREAPMFWTPQSPLAGGPPWKIEDIAFPEAKPVAFEARVPEENTSLLARKGAGLVK
jgi:hypothetical protein